MTDELPVRPAKTWKRVLAAILDFITVFWIGGLVIARLTNETTDSGFALQGSSALVLFALIVVYFVVGRRFAGGTIWDRIFRIQRPQPY